MNRRSFGINQSQPCIPLLKQTHLPSRLNPRLPQMLVSQIGALATTRRAHNEAFLDKKRLADLFDSAWVLTHCCGYGVHANGATFELVNDGRENLVVHVVETVFVHIECF